jgi:LacI family transcriptional regulator
LITIGAFKVLRRLELHRRVALIGFDDILLADLLEPGITVIAQDPAAIGRTAAEVLFRRLDGDRSASEHHVVLTRMITRGSGEIPP